jgi:hypothetical protein
MGVPEMDVSLGHVFAGTCSGQDRYWCECRCGWTSARRLSPEPAYADWKAHAAAALEQQCDTEPAEQRGKR